MAIAYFDSSAFVKLLVEEDGSDIAAALWDGCDAAVSSRLAYPEVRGALAAAGRVHRLGAAEEHQAQAMWEEYWAATRAVALTETIAGRAGDLATEYALRGADAVHLASALAIEADDTGSPSGISGSVSERTKPVCRWRRERRECRAVGPAKPLGTASAAEITRLREWLCEMVAFC